ncbi:MAG: hypothetical protein LBL86_08840 [Coriobacteriales bacterium]|jgi:hypothetical protein|nr:hypothetical protein [Coriobacteriales bacterium]
MKRLPQHTIVLPVLLLLVGLAFVTGMLSACAGDPAGTPPAEQAAPGSATEPGEAGDLVVHGVPGSWSYVNGALSLVGFMEALLAFMGFFFRSKRPPNLFSRHFLLRAVAQAIAFVVLVATCISADFSGMAVAFDKMSIFVIVLFVLQQGALFGARQKRRKRPKLADDEPKEHFRAKTRFDG